jgi:hypothetical protein
VLIGLEKNSRGGANLMFALNVITFVPILYTTTYLGANQEAFGTKLLFGGVVQGFALSMLIWIYFFTEFHADDEAAFVSVFSNLMMNSIAKELNTDAASAGEVTNEASNPPVSEDISSEF